MFGIGEFAALAGVTTRRLRLYDKLGLLVPSSVSSTTRYRSYSARQLLRLNQILVLQDLGFTLEKIGSFLELEPSADELSALLSKQEEQLHAHVEKERARLERVRTMLRRIQRDKQMPPFDIVEKDVPRYSVARLGRRVSTIGRHFDAVSAEMIAELSGNLRSANVRVTGSPIYFLSGKPDGDEFTFYASLPIQHTHDLPPEIDLFVLPAARAAAVISSASGTSRLETIRSAVIALFDWLENRGLSAARPMRSVTLESDASDLSVAKIPEFLVFEHQLPIANS